MLKDHRIFYVHKYETDNRKKRKVSERKTLSYPEFDFGVF